MSVFLISYDLGLIESREIYQSLISYIKSIDAWAKPLQSVWLIKTDKSASEIRDGLKTYLDSNDKVLVIEVKKHWGSFGLSKDVTDWMKENI